MLWQDNLDTQGIGQVMSIALSGKYIYAAGQGGAQCPITCEAILRVYKADTGKVVSTRYIEYHDRDTGNAFLSLGDGYLVMAGSTQTKNGNYDDFINAYLLPNKDLGD
ncbi:MAG: hypothetical protein WDM89_07930 [Rhizomicrobium sp.]